MLHVKQTDPHPDAKPHVKKLSAGALEGLSPTGSGATAAGMRETGRESLTFSGMRDAVFDKFPPLEAVHFNGDGGPDGDGVGLLIPPCTLVLPRVAIEGGFR